MPVLVDRALAGCTIVAPNDGAERPAFEKIRLDRDRPRQQHAGRRAQGDRAAICRFAGKSRPDHWIHLRFFSLEDVARGERARRHLGRSYGDVADLRKANLDALIVTGAEPKAAHLTEEPYWQAFTQLVDWASSNTISSLWSCLAAHAAVLHLDGIERVPLSQKCIGVFDCGTLAAQPLTGEDCRRSRSCRMPGGTRSMRMRSAEAAICCSRARLRPASTPSHGRRRAFSCSCKGIPSMTRCHC